MSYFFPTKTWTLNDFHHYAQNKDENPPKLMLEKDPFIITTVQIIVSVLNKPFI